jgi:hypothetical protein
VDIRIILHSEHSANGERFLRAAMESLGVMAPIVGAFPRASLTLVDPEWRRIDLTAATVVMEPTPWWSSPTAMAPELAAARAIVRRSWCDAVDVSALPPWFVDGLAEYMARRAVVPIFQGTNLEPGYAMLEQRYFGGFVPRFSRVRLRPESDGDPLDAYRARPRIDRSSPGTMEDRRSRAARTVLTLNTLERWLSQPVLDGALAEFARSFHRRRPTIADFIHTTSAASGQDLSWLLVPALAGTATFDYAVASLASVSVPGSGFATTVTVTRLGDGQFTGAAAPRVGPFQSGRGLALEVVFTDGARIVDWWDGRDATRKFEYRSRAAAISAMIDPGRTLVLDVEQTNNSRSLVPQSATAATRWSGRWMIWLEQALLTYAIFV